MFVQHQERKYLVMMNYYNYDCNNSDNNYNNNNDNDVLIVNLERNTGHKFTKNDK